MSVDESPPPVSLFDLVSGTLLLDDVDQGPDSLTEGSESTFCGRYVWTSSQKLGFIDEVSKTVSVKSLLDVRWGVVTGRNDDFTPVALVGTVSEHHWFAIPAGLSPELGPPTCHWCRAEDVFSCSASQLEQLLSRNRVEIPFDGPYKLSASDAVLSITGWIEGRDCVSALYDLETLTLLGSFRSVYGIEITFIDDTILQISGHVHSFLVDFAARRVGPGGLQSLSTSLPRTGIQIAIGRRGKIELHDVPLGGLVATVIALLGPHYAEAATLFHLPLYDTEGSSSFEFPTLYLLDSTTRPTDDSSATDAIGLLSGIDVHTASLEFNLMHYGAGTIASRAQLSPIPSPPGAPSAPPSPSALSGIPPGEVDFIAFSARYIDISEDYKGWLVFPVSVDDAQLAFNSTRPKAN